MTIKEQLIYIREHFPKVFYEIKRLNCPIVFGLGTDEDCGSHRCEECWKNALKKEKK